MKWALFLFVLSLNSFAGDRLSDLQVGFMVKVDALESIDVESGSKYSNGKAYSNTSTSKKFQQPIPRWNDSYCEIAQYNTRSMFDIDLDPKDQYKVIAIDQQCGRDAETAFCRSSLDLKLGLTVFKVNCVSNFGSKTNGADTRRRCSIRT